MKLVKYQDKSKKKRKAILISLGVIVLISISLLLYKTFASFTESAEFQIMNGKVDYFGNSDIYFVFYQEDKQLDEMPQKDNKENLVFDYGECDNGAEIEWNESEWAPLIKGLNKVKTKCSLYFKKYVPTAVEYIMNLAKTDTTNLKADDTSDANIRYVGSSPNNYIDIGDRSLWRIIGVMNNIINLDNKGQQESLVKIIRAESIGNYTWDSSALEINNGYGVNEWSESDLMKLLNPNTVYRGTSAIGESLYWNRGSGSCYRGTKEANTPCEFTNNGISEEAKKKIAKVRWNTGTVGEVYSSSKIIAKYMYEGERSSHDGKEQCKNNNSPYCNDEVERTTTWDGYVGLIYPSDYGYAVGGEVRNTCLEKSMNSYNSDSCNTNDWLAPSSGNSWTITPVLTSTFSNAAFNVSLEGYVNGGLGADCALGVFPVEYLKTSTKITGGTGEIGSPFIALSN